ncbi:MAG: hypothetical protein GOU98_00410 [Candidatus Altiarchaeota archaeon]|nr:hypothetical protein [Candidatus Altiarchaeota archaeon]
MAEREQIDSKPFSYEELKAFSLGQMWTEWLSGLDTLGAFESKLNRILEDYKEADTGRRAELEDEYSAVMKEVSGAIKNEVNKFDMVGLYLLIDYFSWFRDFLPFLLIIVSLMTVFNVLSAFDIFTLLSDLITNFIGGSNLGTFGGILEIILYPIIHFPPWIANVMSIMLLSVWLWRSIQILGRRMYPFVMTVFPSYLKYIYFLFFIPEEVSLTGTIMILGAFMSLVLISMGILAGLGWQALLVIFMVTMAIFFFIGNTFVKSASRWMGSLFIMTFIVTTINNGLIESLGLSSIFDLSGAASLMLFGVLFLYTIWFDWVVHSLVAVSMFVSSKLFAMAYKMNLAAAFNLSDGDVSALMKGGDFEAMSKELSNLVDETAAAVGSNTIAATKKTTGRLAKVRRDATGSVDVIVPATAKAARLSKDANTSISEATHTAEDNARTKTDYTIASFGNQHIVHNKDTGEVRTLNGPLENLGAFIADTFHAGQGTTSTRSLLATSMNSDGTITKGITGAKYMGKHATYGSVFKIGNTQFAMKKDVTTGNWNATPIPLTDSLSKGKLSADDRAEIKKVLADPTKAATRNILAGISQEFLPATGVQFYDSTTGKFSRDNITKNIDAITDEVSLLPTYTSRTINQIEIMANDDIIRFVDNRGRALQIKKTADEVFEVSDGKTTTTIKTEDGRGIGNTLRHLASGDFTFDNRTVSLSNLSGRELTNFVRRAGQTGKTINFGNASVKIFEEKIGGSRFRKLFGGTKRVVEIETSGAPGSGKIKVDEKEFQRLAQMSKSHAAAINTSGIVIDKGLRTLTASINTTLSTSKGVRLMLATSTASRDPVPIVFEKTRAGVKAITERGTFEAAKITDVLIQLKQNNMEVSNVRTPDVTNRSVAGLSEGGFNEFYQRVVTAETEGYSPGNITTEESLVMGTRTPEEIRENLLQKLSIDENDPDALGDGWSEEREEMLEKVREYERSTDPNKKISFVKVGDKQVISIQADGREMYTASSRGETFISTSGEGDTSARAFYNYSQEGTNKRGSVTGSGMSAVLSQMKTKTEEISRIPGTNTENMQNLRDFSESFELDPPAGSAAPEVISRMHLGEVIDSNTGLRRDSHNIRNEINTHVDTVSEGQLLKYEYTDALGAKKELQVRRITDSTSGNRRFVTREGGKLRVFEESQAGVTEMIGGLKNHLIGVGNNGFFEFGRWDNSTATTPGNAEIAITHEFASTSVLNPSVWQTMKLRRGGVDHKFAARAGKVYFEVSTPTGKKWVKYGEMTGVATFDKSGTANHIRDPIDALFQEGAPQDINADLFHLGQEVERVERESTETDANIIGTLSSEVRKRTQGEQKTRTKIRNVASNLQGQIGKVHKSSKVRDGRIQRSIDKVKQEVVTNQEDTAMGFNDVADQLVGVDKRLTKNTNVSKNLRGQIGKVHRVGKARHIKTQERIDRVSQDSLDRDRQIVRGTVQMGNEIMEDLTDHKGREVGNDPRTQAHATRRGRPPGLQDGGGDLPEIGDDPEGQGGRPTPRRRGLTPRRTPTPPTDRIPRLIGPSSTPDPVLIPEKAASLEEKKPAPPRKTPRQLALPPGKPPLLLPEKAGSHPDDEIPESPDKEEPALPEKIDQIPRVDDDPTPEHEKEPAPPEKQEPEEVEGVVLSDEEKSIDNVLKFLKYPFKREDWKRTQGKTKKRAKRQIEEFAKRFSEESAINLQERINEELGLNLNVVGQQESTPNADPVIDNRNELINQIIDQAEVEEGPGGYYPIKYGNDNYAMDKKGMAYRWGELNDGKGFRWLAVNRDELRRLSNSSTPSRRAETPKNDEEVDSPTQKRRELKGLTTRYGTSVEVHPVKTGGIFEVSSDEKYLLGDNGVVYYREGKNWNPLPDDRLDEVNDRIMMHTIVKTIEEEGIQEHERWGGGKALALDGPLHYQLDKEGNVLVRDQEEKAWRPIRQDEIKRTYRRAYQVNDAMRKLGSRLTRTAIDKVKQLGGRVELNGKIYTISKNGKRLNVQIGDTKGQLSKWHTAELYLELRDKSVDESQ